ncbi:MAG: alkaline phosphatase family protein [Thermoleophilia bacterium]
MPQPKQPASRPRRVPTASAPGAAARVVVFLQENKTTDFYFPTMARWGAAVADHGGLLSAAPDFDQPHDRDSWVHYRMGDYAAPALQVNNDAVIPYYSWLAKTFVFSDHHFGLGTNSTPGHMLAMGGQAPTMKNPPFTGPSPVWDLPSIFSVADDAGVEWAAFPGGGGYPTKFYKSLTTAAAADRILTPSRFEPMAKAGALPPVTYVWSPSGFDEHPPTSSNPGYITDGEALVWRRVQAVIDGGGWDDTVFILTWDDWGGYADSVPTPDIETVPDALHPDGFQAIGGSRIPLLMFGGRVRQAIDTAWHSHASIPRTIIDLLGLPEMGVPRVDSAPTLAGFVDATLSRPRPPAPGAQVRQPAAPSPRPRPVPPAPWPGATVPMPALVTLGGPTLAAPVDGTVRPKPPPPPTHHGQSLPVAANPWSAAAGAGRTALPGSERQPVGRVIGSVAHDDVVQVTLVLRRRKRLTASALRHGMTSAELEQRHGADPADVAAVTSVVQGAGAHVVDVHAASRRVRVEGTVGVLADLFGAELRGRAHLDGTTFRLRTGGLSVPQPLANIVVAVLGLDDRPQAATRSVVADPRAVSTSFTPVQLAALYGMPAGDGGGQHVAIIELGGGFAQSDLTTYFGGLGLPTPTVTAVGVDGAANIPGGDPTGADGEVLLDIEVAGAIAPASTLSVYFAPNSDAGFLDAVSEATHASPTPVAISISWGQSEDRWTAQARSAMDAAFADAAALGITVTAAAGDSGSADGDTSAPGVHVDFPASSPHVVACGGTTLQADGGTVTSETVWNNGASRGATGGGVSDAFGLPNWQAHAGVPPRVGGQSRAGGGRGVPDVAAVADPTTGYQVLVDGRSTVIGGTSAVAPLWAGLVARIVQVTGRRPGLMNPTLYGAAPDGGTPTGMRDITTGSNGAYQAGPGWDACTGLGVPAPGIETLF